MQALKSQTALRRGGIVYLRTDELTPNPVQPRKRFDDESLEELSGSIKSYGILNPLTVRLRCGKYELVAGERRLRAAKLAGLEEVPCILIDVNMEDASLIALLRLPNPVAQRAALEYIVDNGLTVAATDAYIDALLSAPEEAEQKDEEKPEKRRTFVLKDVRVFLNTLSRSIDLMKQGGIDAGIQREETDDSLILTISIPKARQPSQNG